MTPADHLRALTGTLHVNAWYGRGSWPVEIIRETPKRYEIRAIVLTSLPGDRRLQPGETALVPKYAVSLDSK